MARSLDRQIRINHLKQLIIMATQLGFWDDVAAHKAELKKLEEED